MAVCSLDQDRSRALDRARALLTQYPDQQPHIMQASGVGQDPLGDGPATIEAFAGGRF